MYSEQPYQPTAGDVKKQSTSGMERGSEVYAADRKAGLALAMSRTRESTYRYESVPYTYLGNSMLIGR